MVYQCLLLSLSMNYLAHAYLSFGNEEILAGNLFSDYVKGKKQFDYTGLLHKGIRLHRMIDAFTDAHPSTAAVKLYFKPDYGLYAGAFVDVVYDYFLANDTSIFNTNRDLELFAQHTYQMLENQFDRLPPNFQPVFLNMRKYDWLYNYQFTWGIQKSFAGLAYRAKYINETDTAFAIFEQNIHLIKPHYDHFFPLLKNYAADTLSDLLKDD